MCTTFFLYTLAPTLPLAHFRGKVSSREPLSGRPDYILGRASSTHCHLVCELHPATGLGCGSPIVHLHRFYRTRGRCPGHDALAHAAW